MEILITGFEPFQDNMINPSEEILKYLPKTIYGNNIHKVVLPVTYKHAFETLEKYMNETNFDAILMIGVAKGRKHITPERVAININDSTVPDNAGKMLNDTPIIKTGDKAYFSSLPIKTIVTKLTQKSIPVKVSNTAGTFVCNDLFYRLMHHISTNKLDIKAGFIHIPQMDSNQHQDIDTLPFDRLLEGIIDSIKTIL